MIESSLGDNADNAVVVRILLMWLRMLSSLLSGLFQRGLRSPNKQQSQNNCRIHRGDPLTNLTWKAEPPMARYVNRDTGMPSASFLRECGLEVRPVEGR